MAHSLSGKAPPFIRIFLLKGFYEGGALSSILRWASEQKLTIGLRGALWSGEYFVLFKAQNMRRGIMSLSLSVRLKKREEFPPPFDYCPLTKKQKQSAFLGYTCLPER